MQVTQIKIQNILGIKSLEIKPGAVTVISGRNASGKTSVLEAIKALIKGGKDATLLRHGEKEGSVVMLLDDGRELTRKVTEKTDTVSVRKEGFKSSAPRADIGKLTDIISVNPVSFLAAPKKNRTQILLESIPLKLDLKAIKDATGFTVKPTEEHALVLLDRIHTTIYDKRTGINRAGKEKDGNIKQLQQSLPADPVDSEALKSQADELTQTVDAIHTKADADVEEIQLETQAKVEVASTEIEDLTVKREKLRQDAQAKANQVKVDAMKAAEKKINQINVQAIKDINAAAKEIEKLTENRSALHQDAQTRTHRVKQESTEKASESETELATIRERLEACAQYDNTKQIIQQYKGEWNDLVAESKALSESLSGLADYKQTLLAKLPIKGLEIRDGDIYLDDVPFNRVNASEQVKVAIQIARLRSPKLGLMCVDGLELLDSDHYQAFVKHAKGGDIQMIITRVSDKDLKVEAA